MQINYHAAKNCLFYEKKWWQVYCSFSRKIYKEEKTTKIEDSESVKIGRPSKGKLQ